MQVKDNHPTLRKKIASFFRNPALYQAEFAHAGVTELKRRGRVETRSLQVSDDVPRGFTGFAGVRQLFRLERQVLVKRTGEVHSEEVYGMTSLARAWCPAERLLSLVRGHWTIENRVHYVRDVTMGEDKSQTRSGSLPQVMAMFRGAALALVRSAGYGNVAAARRYLAARPTQALKLMGCQITE